MLFFRGHVEDNAEDNTNIVLEIKGKLIEINERIPTDDDSETCLYDASFEIFDSAGFQALSKVEKIDVINYYLNILVEKELSCSPAKKNIDIQNVFLMDIHSMTQVAPTMAKGYPKTGLAEAFYNIFSLAIVRENFQIAKADQDKLDTDTLETLLSHFGQIRTTFSPSPTRIKAARAS